MTRVQRITGLALSCALLCQTLPFSSRAVTTEGGVPYFYQNDYPTVRYGGSSVNLAGSSIVALSMLAVAYTGDSSLTPDVLASRYGSYAGSSSQRLEFAATKLGLSFRKATNWNETLTGLKDGKMAIIQTNERSLFSNGVHYILATGLTSDGKVLVHDPNRKNSEDKYLASCYVDGFPRGNITNGYSGAWIFDPDGQPNQALAVEESEDGKLRVPLYYQNDYPNTRYADGTVESSGCSMTSLAMVATALTGTVFTPDELAAYFGAEPGTHVDRLLYGAQQLQLPIHQSENWHETAEAVKNGAIAIVLTNSRSIFTNTQHFIVVTGVSDAGGFLVNDPYAPNYEKWDLKDGFSEGFSQEQITNGYAGSWYFDPAEMPDEPFVYTPPVEDYVEPRYPGLSISDEELELLARMVWVEARGEPFEGQQAVAEVVLNRLKASNFPDTIFDVIFAAGQFRSAKFVVDAKPTQTQYNAVIRALRGPYVLDENVGYFAQYKVNENLWGQIGGHYFCYMESPEEQKSSKNVDITTDSMIQRLEKEYIQDLNNPKRQESCQSPTESTKPTETSPLPEDLGEKP